MPYLWTAGRLEKFIASLSPERWKVFQFIHMKGQNDDAVDLAISKEQFEKFKEINGNLILKNGTNPVFEADSDMLNSYFIIGPDGNIIISRNNKRSVLPFESINTLDFSGIVDIDKYYERKAIYDWNRK
jgi:radical S-adenosyl methionine domain-containing protein 2